jgi:ATP-dependent Clp protease ATP-binding subunit ClpA
MTSNLGASEMSALMTPRLGFNAGESVRQSQNGIVDEKMSGKLARSGVDAAKRKFTPEFINRLDKIVTFKPLGTNELRRILDIELNMVQQRIFNTSPEKSFVFKASGDAKDFLLKEGTDLKYGARHLKRAIERLLVQPMSNLIATDQVRGGDCVYVDFDAESKGLNFLKEAEGLAVNAMADLVDRSVSMPAFAMATGAFIEAAKTQSARSSKRA